MAKFADLADMDEDDRIKKIGETAIKTGTVVGFVTDDDEGKSDRYIRKLKEQFPSLKVIHHDPGPVPHTILVKVQRES